MNTYTVLLNEFCSTVYNEYCLCDHFVFIGKERLKKEAVMQSITFTNNRKQNIFSTIVKL